MKSLISRILLSVFLIAACMAVPAPLSLAQSDQNVSASNTNNVDCNLTPNPDLCWRQKSQQTWNPSDIQSLPLNSSTWGLEGPLTASLRYDSDLNWIFGLGYLQMFNESLGIAAKASLGGNEWRANITGGYKINDRHQIKLTYEYLSQNLPYDFESGSINNWVYQHGVGATYQYLLRQGIVHSLEISGVFAKAQSKNLSDIIFYEGDDALVNLRRIAGGQETTGLATVNILPLSTTTLALGAGYSQVIYDTMYENGQNNSTVAYKVELGHVFHPTLKVSASVNNTASSTEYNAKVSKLLPKNFELSLGGLRQDSRGNLPNANSVVLGLSYPAPKTYSMDNLAGGGFAELKSWIDTPVLYYNRVLAVKDEAVKKFFIASQAIPSQTKAIGQTIDPVETKKYFQFDQKMYDQVKFTLSITPAVANKAAGKAKTAAGQDYAKALNIIITQKSPYEATVSSKAPIPGDQNLEGQYNVSITAIGTKSGLKQPITETRTFGLTVIYAGPEWTNKFLPAATINTNYPYPDTEVDLEKNSGTSTGFVSTPDLPKDTYTFKLLKGPSWIQLKDQHLLVANGSVQQADTKPVPVELEVTSQTLHQSSAKTFELQVNAGAPVWSDKLPDGQYGVTYSTINLKAYVSSPGDANTQYTFKENQPLPVWLQLSSDGTLKGVQNIPESASKDLQLYVTANDTQTGQSTSGILTITIQPGVPVWTDNTLPDAQEGVSYGTIDLSPKLHTPGLPGDSYQMTLTPTAVNPAWLKIVNGHYLTSDGPIPSNASTAVSVTITALSLGAKGNLSATQTFKLDITKPGAPIWKQTDLPNGQYGSPYITTNLHQYVETPNNANDQYKFSLNQPLPSWLKLNDDGTITATQPIPDGAPKVQEIYVTVFSVISNASTSATLIINIGPGNPVWIDNTLPDAQQGIPYESVDLSPKIRTPGLPGDTYKMTLSSNSPSWLKIDNNHYLVANGDVPSNAPDSVKVTMTAVSENAPNTTAAIHTFDLTITKPNSPIWTQTDLPNGQYNTVYPLVDLHQYVTTPKNSDDKYSFSLDPSQSLPSWLGFDKANGTFKGLQNIPDTAPRIFEVAVIVTSTVTGASTSATLVINIQPGIPVWIDETLPTAQQQITYESVDLSPKLYTPGLPGDTYQMTLDSDSPSWLKIQNGHFLVGNGPVPADAPAFVIVTVTAFSQAALGNLSATQKFKLIVTKPGAPVWNLTDLPDGRYGAIYSSTVDLNTYVSTPTNPDDTFSFKFIQPLPAWLSLASDGHTLTGTQVAIPENAPKVVELHVVVTNSELMSVPAVLVLNVLPGSPIWSGNLPAAEYNVTYSGADLLPLLRTPGVTSDNYEFTLDQAPGWLKLAADGHSLIGQSPVPDTDPTPVTVSISAKSTTSLLTTSHTFSVTINPGAPVWTDKNLSDAQQGGTYTEDLSGKLFTPGIPKDTYKMELESPSVSWLKIGADGHSLTGEVPNNQTSPVELKVKATSNGDGKSADQVFSLTVTEVGAPIWNLTDLPDGHYDAVYSSTVDLNTYVSTPTNPNDTFSFKFVQPLPSWLSLASDGHTLTGTQVAIPENAPQVLELKVIVTNSQLISTSGVLELKVLPGFPIWSGNLPAAEYNVTYSDVNLLPLVRTPGAPSDNYEFTLDQAPGWLKLGADGHSLIGQSPVSDTDPNPVTVLISVKSAASSLTTQHAFSLTINPGAPVWTDQHLSDAQQGVTYTEDLSGKLFTPGIPKDTYKMELESPSVSWLKIGADGHSLTGEVPNNQTSPVELTVKATSNGDGKSADQVFSLTVTEVGAPIWNSTDLPDGHYDAVYSSTVDLNTYVSTPTNPNDTFSFKFVQPLPSWLSLASDGHTLTGTQVAIPENVPQVLELNVIVTNSRQISTPGVLELKVLPGSPVWSGNLPAAEYNVTYSDVNLLPLVRTPGAPSDNYEFTLDQAPGWLKLGADGHSLIGQSPVPDTDPSPVTVLISVKSTASSLTTQHAFSVTINPGAPVWTDQNLSDAQQGVTYTEDLSGKLFTPGIPKDTYKMELESPSVSWLKIGADGHSLTGEVPNNQTSPVELKVKATSSGDGKSAEQVFSLTVTETGSPIWTNTDLPDGYYDAVYNANNTPINLNNYVTTPNNINDQYTFSADSLPSWLALDSTTGILQGKGDIPESSPKEVQIQMTAASNFTHKSIEGTLVINVRPGAPIWSGDLNPAQYNEIYSGTNLLSLVRTPGAGSDTYQFSLDNPPTWLKLSSDGHTLVGNEAVPENATSPMVVQITAKSTASQQSSSISFSLIINPGIPVWTNNTLENAQQGVTYPTIDLADKLYTPGLANDTYHMTLDTNVSWLKIGADGHSLEGVDPVPTDAPSSVQITVTATSQKATGNLSASQTFTITILDGLGWSGLNPDATTAGTDYNYTVDQLVSCPVNQQCTIGLSNLPTWLDAKVNPDGTTSLISNQPVPAAAQDPSGTVSFDVAASTKSGGTLPVKTFSILINNVLPVWQDPANIPSLNFDGSSDPHLIPLNSYIIQGSDGLTIAPGSNFNATNWKIVKEGTDYYLARLPTATTDDIGKQISVPVVATNSTSHTTEPHLVKVNVTPNADLSPPAWSGAAVPPTTAGDVKYSYVANELVTCPTGDQCTLALTNVPKWLDVQVATDGTVTLVNNQIVPPAAQDPSGIVTFDVAVSSLKSGKVLPAKTFDIAVINVLPKWNDLPPVDIYYDGTSPDNTIHLNDYITAGTNAGVAFAPGTNFDSNQWQIIHQAGSSDYYLKKLGPGDPGEIGNSLSISLLAKNTTSIDGAEGVVAINLIADPEIGPPILKGDILDADMGYPYATVDLNEVFSAPASNDTLTFSFPNGNPSWLAIQPCSIGNQPSYCLMANGDVPTSAGPSFTVTIRALSKASGHYIDQSFTKNIIQKLPGWINNPSGVVQFNDNTTSIALNPFITSNSGNQGGSEQPALYFKMHNPNDPNWQVTETAGTYYLHMTTNNPAYNNANLVGQPVYPEPIIDAYNNTSNSAVIHSIQVISTPDSQLNGPEWSNNVPDGATAGQPVQSYSYPLHDLFNCAANDYCSIAVDLSQINWLQSHYLNGAQQAFLENSAEVPAAAVDPEGPSAPITVTVQSLASGKVISKAFNIQITNVLPIWDQTSIASVIYNGTSPDTMIHLNDYISVNTNIGLTFAPSTDFDPNKWQIINPTGTSDYYLKKLAPGDVDEIGTQEAIPVLAKNLTSVSGKASGVLVNILDDGSLPGPDWTITKLPDAKMGYTYGDGTNTPIVNLNNMVITTGEASDIFTFAFDDKINPHPSWLNIDQNGHLVSSSLVPTTAGATFTVAITATSKASGNQTTFTFSNVPIIETLPGWDSNQDYTEWSILYDDTSKGIELNKFITSGINNLSISFPNQQMVDGNWKIEKDASGNYYLRRTTGSDPLPADLDTIVPLSLVAHNSTSSDPTQETHPQLIKVHVLPDNNLGAPVWNGTSISDAYMGFSYGDADKTGIVDLNEKVSTSNVGSDRFTFTFDDTDAAIGKHPDWLTLNNGNLSSDPTVDNGLVPKTSAAPFSVKIIAKSTASGLETSFIFSNIPIIQTLPKWDSLPAVDLYYDGTSPNTTIHLNNYVVAGTNANISFAPGTGFDSSKWQIQHQPGSSDYYLVKLSPGNPNEVDTQPSIQIMAINSTSIDGDGGAVAINLIADPALGTPIQIGNLLDADMGYPYSQTDLNAVFTGPVSGDILSFTFPNGDQPNWLQIQPCTINGNASICLEPNGDVPTSAGNNFIVTIRAQSKASGLYYDHQFTAPIKATLPAWISNPSGDIQFNSTTTGIELGQFITPNTSGNQQGTQQPALHFAMANSADPNWTISETGGKYYLYMTENNPAYNNAANVGTPIDAQVVAYNNTSDAPVSKFIQVTTTADSQLPGPGWNNNSLAGATAGQAIQTYNYPLNNLFICQPNDACTISVDLTNVPWLTSSYDGATQQTLLENSEIIPTAATDAGAPTLPITVTVKSLASNKTISKDFTIQVSNLLPAWDQTAISDLNYNGTSPETTIHLNQYVTAATSAGLSFLPGTGFDPDKWQIMHQPGSSDYYLVKLAPGDPSEIGSQPSIPVLAKNSTSVSGKDNGVLINIMADNTLPAPDWTTDILPSANMGYSYSVDLSQIAKSSIANDILTFEFEGTNPSWLSVNGNQLVSNGNVPNDQGTTFTVTLKVTSTASGNSKSITFTNVPIIQTLPKWNTLAAQDLYYDGTSPQTTIHLNDYVTAGTDLNISFVPGNNFDNTTWGIVQSGTDYYLVKKAPGDPSEITDGQPPIDVTVMAKNSTSIDGAGGTVAVNLIADPALGNPAPSGDILAAQMGYPYSELDLNSLFTGPVTNDTLSFSVQNGDLPTWLQIQSCTIAGKASTCLEPNGDVPTSAASNFTVTIRALSKASGLYIDHQFTNTIQQTLPAWVDKPSGSIQFNSTTAGIELGQLITTDTRGNLDGTQQPALKFALQNPTDPNWTVSESGGKYYLYMTVNNPAYNNIADIGTPLTAQVLAYNNTSNTSVPMGVMVTTTGDTSKPIPTWTGKLLPVIYGGEPGRFQYAVNIDSSYVTDTSGATTSYSCKIQSNVSWLVPNPNNPAGFINDPNVNVGGSPAKGGVPATDTPPQIQLTCISNQTGQATQPKPFTVDVAPVLKLATDSDIPSSIKFDDIDNGIKLSDFMVSGRTGANFTLTGADSGYKAANWVVATDNSSNQYLRRQLINSPQQIDASELSSNSGLVNINLQVKNTTSLIADSATRAVTVTPDPTLFYQYTDPTFQSAVDAINPDAGAGVYQSAAMVNSSTVQGFMTAANSVKYPVINDSNFGFTAPNNAPSFINYSAVPKIAIGFPSYSDLGQTNLQWTVNVNSLANGQTANTMQMPPLSVKGLVLTPPASYSTSGIMTLGMTHQDSNLLQVFWTYLQLSLKPNTTYNIKQVKYFLTADNGYYRQICSGRVTQTPGSTSCGNGSTQLGFLPDMNGNNGSASFTTDSTGVVTFIVASINGDGNSKRPAPVFLTAPDNPMSLNQNTVLTLP